MTTKTIYVERYAVYHHLGSKYLCTVRIINQDKIQGLIEFFPDGSGQKSIAINKNGIFELRFDINRYKEIMETLRYEKPVRIGIRWGSDNIITAAIICTGSEPIGEQEI